MTLPIPPSLPRFPIVLLVCWTAAARAGDRDYQLITQGGGRVELGKAVPGVLDITDDTAFPVLQDAEGRIVAAAGPSGKGRVVAFSHGGFLKSDNIPGQPGVGDLVANAARWAGKSGTPRVAIHPSLRALAGLLKEAGLAAEPVAIEDLGRGEADVYCSTAQRDLSEGEIVKLFEFLNDGGGLVISATPWAFKKDYPEFATAFPGNQLLARAGFRFLPDGYAKTDTPLRIGNGNTDAPTPAPTAPMKPDGTPLAPAPAPKGDGKAIAAARLLAEKGNSLPAAERDRLIADLKTGGDLRGDDLTAFLESLQALNRAVGPIFPTLENPVTPGADPLVDAVIGLETDLDRSLPPGAMYAIPAAAEYPGAVPEKAERAAVTLSIDGKYRGWLRGRGAGGWAAKEMRPTGVYAAPGEVVKVTVPARVAGEGFEVVIGAYNGGLDNRDRWQRYPKLQRNFPVASRVTEASNALGGLVTIRIPREADYDSLEITIEGGVRAPLFVEGQTDPKAWKDEIRKYPAPWAELAGKRIILALPSEHIRNLGDPDKVLAVWDEILDKAAELCGGVNRDDYRAERIVFERQPSAGYMHSGYPVAAPQDKSVAQAVDARALREEGNWGFFHEYGHNHQHDLWSLPGTGETTCNLWSVYLFEEYIGKKREEGHNAVRPLERRERMNAYFSSGRNFDSEWSMWVALEAYLQVQEAFGWEPFKKVFAEYNTLPEREWPKTQQEKNDQWVLRLSRACGKNLAPFWAAWNLPLSEKVFTELAGLPAWEDHPVARYFK